MPIFDTLTSIVVVGRNTPNPVMRSVITDVNQFWNETTVFAVYQRGRNGPTVRRTNVWEQLGIINDGTLTNTIGNPSDPNNPALIPIAQRYRSSGRFSRANVEFSSSTAGLGSATIQRRSGRIDIGADGYPN